MRKLGLRRRLLLVQLAAVALAVAALVVGFNLVLQRTLDQDARALVRSRAAAQLSSLRVERGRLTVGDAPDNRSSDSYVWVFTKAGILEQPRAPAAVQEAVRKLVRRPTRFVDVASTDTRLYAASVLVKGKRTGTVVAGVSLAPYEETREAALVASFILGVVIFVLVALVGWWVLGASLRPVVRMTRQAAAWSEHDLDHRFALGPPDDELSELAATLDGLLDRIATTLRRERRFSAELSHELRTPLARVLAQCEFALHRPRRPEQYERTLELIHGNANQLARTVDALVAAQRYEAGGSQGTADAAAVAATAADACSGLADERQVALEVTQPPQPMRIGVDPDLAERILQPVVENACRYATTRVRITIGRADAAVCYDIEDDGPGVHGDEQERIFEPGVRGTAATAGAGAGAGLGLALARRLARSVDGEVRAETPATGGRFLVRLPTG
jgi:signal transduction histidine kinase